MATYIVLQEVEDGLLQVLGTTTRRPVQAARDQQTEGAFICVPMANWSRVEVGVTIPEPRVTAVLAPTEYPAVTVPPPHPGQTTIEEEVEAAELHEAIENGDAEKDAA